MDKIICENCSAENSTNFKYCKSCGYALPIIIQEIIEEKVEEKPNIKKMDRKKLIGLFTGIFTFYLAYFAVQQLFFKKPSFDKVMMEAASELNKTCPLMIDQYTRLDNAVALPDNIFQYNYTLVELTKEEINLDTVRKYIEPNIINNVKTNPDLKIYRENKTTMSYVYRDKNGVFVHKLSVTPEMYEQETSN